MFLALVPSVLRPAVPGMVLTLNEERRIESLLSQMTLDERIGQLVQWSANTKDSGGTEAVLEKIRLGAVGSLLNVKGPKLAMQFQRVAVEESRLKIPLLLGYDVIHGYRTIFPIPLAEAASFDPSLAEESARLAASEASREGVNWTFAPMVDIARDPRWGRIAEGSGEDPVLGAAMAAARVRGFQGTDLHDPSRLAACAKHYLGYGFAEGGRDYNTSNFGPRTLREIVLPPFIAAVQAGAVTVMSSFNEIDGEPVSGSRRYVTDLLRGELEFGGLVISDWNSIGELTQHGVAANHYEAAVRGLNAGVDIDMQSGAYSESLKTAVQNGAVTERTLNEAVRHVLRVKMMMGLFEKPYRNTDAGSDLSLPISAEYRAHARKAARESIVLLKNDGDILPFSKTVKTVAVIGPMSRDTENPIGTWSAYGDAKDVISLYDGIRNALPGAHLVASEGCDYEGNGADGIQQAVSAAAAAEIVVVAVGETRTMSGENSSRSSLELPGMQEDLILELAKLKKPMAVVVMSGRPNALLRVANSVGALLVAWHPGVEAGNGIADVLFGDYNPGGKLPASFPRVTGQVPIYYNHKNTGRPLDGAGKPRTGYVDLAAGPLFPFGYGLSYTTFEYSNLRLSSNKIKSGETLAITVTLKNTGKREGQEVVQLYIHDPVASVTQPVRALRHFTKVLLQAGESRDITFQLSDDDLAIYNLDMKRVVEPGVFEVYVGGNSNATLTASFTLE